MQPDSESKQRRAPAILGRRIPSVFYRRDVRRVAPALLGKLLIRRRGRRHLTIARITETEAYGGRGDRASHAYRGRTTRNAVMFGPPGHAYVYFTYGMHWLLNVVTGKEGEAAAVLIRGIELLPESAVWGVGNSEKRRQNPTPASLLPPSLNGPAKLTKFLGVNGALNGEDLRTSRRLWIEEPRAERRPRPRMVRTPRIGVDYAGPAARWRRRYVLAVPS